MLKFVRAVKHPKATFVLALGGGFIVLGVFLTMNAYQEKGDAGVTSFIGTIAQVLGVPSIPGFYENLGRAALAAEGGMVDALPPGRDGWARRDWQAEDAAGLVAAGQVDGQDLPLPAAELVSAFEDVSTGATPGVLETYVRGDERIVVMIRRLPQAQRDSGGAGLAARVSAVDEAVASGQAPLAVHGVALTGATGPDAEGLPFIALRGVLAGQIIVEAASNTDRGALVKLLSGLDMDWLNRFADTPDPIVSAQKGVTVAPGLVAGTPAPIRPAVEVTRGAPRAQDPVAGEAVAGKPVICIRRAGKRVCN